MSMEAYLYIPVNFFKKKLLTVATPGKPKSRKVGSTFYVILSELLFSNNNIHNIL